MLATVIALLILIVLLFCVAICFITSDFIDVLTSDDVLKAERFKYIFKERYGKSWKNYSNNSIVRCSSLTDTWV